MSDIGPVERLLRDSTGSDLIDEIESVEGPGVMVIDQIRAHDAEDAARDEALRQAVEALGTCIEGFRLTREYVGEELLPDIAGWSHFDAAAQARAAIAAIEALEVTA